MELRRLGSSDLEISRLGFGAWSIGGSGWAYDGDADRDKTSLQALAHAVGEGVNWVDTAPTYGQGHSEELVGRAVQQLGSERALIFTKCGRHWDSPTAQPRSDLRPEAIRTDCEASLRRLGVEVIDLLQIHWPESPPHTPIEESWTQMRRLVDEGKIRAAGVSNFGVDLLERCEAVGHVDSVQLPFSLIARKSADGLLQWCAEHDTGVLAYSPMQIGLLTDSFTPEKIPALHPDDWRRRHPEFQSPRLERNLTFRDGLRQVGSAHDASVSAVAIAWVLAWPQVTGAIVGARMAGQVDEWVHAADITLSDADLGLIEELLQRSGAGAGPMRPAQANTTST